MEDLDELEYKHIMGKEREKESEYIDDFNFTHERLRDIRKKKRFERK